MLDTVEVLSHRSFATLLKQAKSLLEQTLGDRVDEATVVVNPRLGQPVRPSGGRASFRQTSASPRQGRSS